MGKFFFLSRGKFFLYENFLYQEEGKLGIRTQAFSEYVHINKKRETVKKESLLTRLRQEEMKIR